VRRGDVVARVARVDGRHRGEAICGAGCGVLSLRAEAKRIGDCFARARGSIERARV
jgi:hypothetical protein